jgi:hypothetical protein
VTYSSTSFDPEVVGSVYLRNGGSTAHDHTMDYPKNWMSMKQILACSDKQCAVCDIVSRNIFFSVYISCVKKLTKGIHHIVTFYYYYYYLVCEAIGIAPTPGLLCQPRVIVKMIVEKRMECRLAGETEVLGENLPQRHFCPSQNPSWPDPGLNPGRRGGNPATNRLSYGAATLWLRFLVGFHIEMMHRYSAVNHFTD